MTYYFGGTLIELQRLITPAEVLKPITERMLHGAFVHFIRRNDVGMKPVPAALTHD